VSAEAPAPGRWPLRRVPAGLARPKWPEDLRIVDDFPRTAAGKIRKVELRARLRAEADQGSDR